MHTKTITSLLLSYVLGYMYIYSFLAYEQNYQFFQVLFVIGFIFWVEFLSKDIKITRFHYLLIFSLLLIIFNLNYNDYSILYNYSSSTYTSYFFSYNLLHILAVTYLISRFNKLTYMRISYLWLLELLNYFFIPFKHLLLRTTILYKTIHKSIPKVNIKLTLIYIIIILFSFIIFNISLDLLMNSDKGFEAFVLNITDFDIFYFFNIYLILSIPVGCYLFALIHSTYLNKNSNFDVTKINMFKLQIKKIPNNLINFLFSIFILLYLIYILFQAEYLFSALYGILPANFTFSEYARKGFFELCTIVGINVIFTAFLNSIAINSSLNQKGTRIFASILMIESFILLITACSKLSFYIFTYGLTSLRLLSSWWLIVLLVFIIYFTKSLHKDITFINKVFNISLICFLITTLIF